jgi:hypothetical protein
MFLLIRDAALRACVRALEVDGIVRLKVFCCPSSELCTAGPGYSFR